MKEENAYLTFLHQSENQTSCSRPFKKYLLLSDHMCWVLNEKGLR